MQNSKVKKFALACATVLLCLALLYFLHLPSRSSHQITGSSSASGAAPVIVRQTQNTQRSTAATEQDKVAEFSCRTGMTYWKRIHGNRIPDDIANNLLCGSVNEGVAQLGALADAGDSHAQSVLITLASSCRFGGGVDRQSYRQRVTDKARAAGRPQIVIDRIERILSDEENQLSQYTKETCADLNSRIRGQLPGMINRITALLGRSIKQLLAENPEAMDLQIARELAATGGTFEQYLLAQKLLVSEQAPDKAEGVALIQDLAATLPEAKAQLAHCMLSGCPKPFGDPADAQAKLREAALSGDEFTLLTLSAAPGSEALSQGTDLTLGERYAWWQLYDHLKESGCFGPSVYISWAILPSSPPDLLLLSPAEDTAAREQARTLLEQADAIKVRLQCSDNNSPI